MESHIIVDIVVIVILVVLSSYFSATETAFTSLNRIKMKNMAGDGNKRAELVLRLEENYDKLLTTILIGNNIVNITMTAISTLLFVELFGAYGPTLSTIVITVVVLVFGEITPKGIAKESAESFSLFSAPIIRMLMVLMTPINFLFTKWKQLMAKIFKFGDDRTITEDELLTIVEEAENVGGIDNEQSELIQNAIEFNELTAWDVLTPRVDMEAIDVEDSKEEVAKLFKKTGFSRLPVYEDDIDKIMGVLNQKDFHNYIVGTNKNISDYVMPVVFVAGAIKVSALLRKMQQMKTHLAIVIDEYGGTEGLVTMEDIIEELVGEIYDEHDAVMSQEIIPLQNGSYRVKCNASIAKVFDFFDIEEDMDVQTVNGWVVVQLDKLPVKNDTFQQQIENKLLKVRVTKADDRRALEINLVVEEIEPEEERKGEQQK
ncbi:hemolysin family protein [Anaerovorax odorimutans]|uniref:Hemolysin family protein n=1 Tax=Anaerovorax odorimutans TaxID=109327 RepID=A0ABT1RQS5_9FIRM|nr:hemolysin family protein [Anaerovorax odorimutans]MCQ4637547.1 hemolysin family protein [Anaerovorax odorimutans]